MATETRTLKAWRAVAVTAAIATIVAVFWGVLSRRSSEHRRLPSFGSVPTFNLVGADGAPVAASSLRGRIWVADFIYTTCPSFCPRLTEQMARIQGALGQTPATDVGLVSFSVDPAHDTPDVLRVYAQRFQADPTRWLFLTGTRDDLYRIIGKGFLLPVAESPSPEGGGAEGPITHTNRFVLIDRGLRIRGYYQGTEAVSVEQILADIEILRNES